MNPGTYEVSRQQQVLDILRNVTTSPPDRVRSFSFSGGGGSYAALFDGDEERWPPFVAGIDPLLQRLKAAAITPAAAGDGSLRFRDELQAAGVAVAPAESPLHVVNAGHLCRRALETPDVAPEQVVPNYLREPDAVPR